MGEMDGSQHYLIPLYCRRVAW